MLHKAEMSLGYPWLITGIPVGKPVGMATHRSKLLVITGLHRSGCLFWVLQVLATHTNETIVFLFFTNLIHYLFYYKFSELTTRMAIGIIESVVAMFPLASTSGKYLPCLVLAVNNAQACSVNSKQEH